MSAPPNRAARCQVIGGDKLPADSGGAAALCAAIERAVSAAAPGAQFAVEVQVRPNSMLSAKVVVNGRALPEQKFASMDREFDRTAFERFARSLAERVASSRNRE